MSTKYEVARPKNGGCFLCLSNDRELYLAREAATCRLTALCSSCLLLNLEDYLIDNTRAWPLHEEDRCHREGSGS